jgi:hypothetical protein
MSRISNAIAVAICFWPVTTLAQTDAEVSRHRVLEDIAWMANQTCTKAATGGSTQNVEVSASVQADLDNLLRKLAKLGVGAAASYKTEKHEGVLVGEVLAAAKVSNDCKLNVTNMLADRFLPKAPGVVQTTYGKNSPVVSTLNGDMVINDGAK